MASSSKRKGSVKTVEWAKHIRDHRSQWNRVRADGKRQIEEETNELFNWDHYPDLMDVTEEQLWAEMSRVGYHPDRIEHWKECFEEWEQEYKEWLDWMEGMA